VLRSALLSSLSATRIADRMKREREREREREKERERDAERKSVEFVPPLRYSFRDNVPHSRRFISTFA